MAERRGPWHVRRWVNLLLVVAFVAAPLVVQAAGDTYKLTFLSRVVIMGLAASGLNIALGYGGMVSFGHALYLAIGAYSVAVLQAHGVTSGLVQFSVGIGLGLVVSLIVGTVCLRTSGVAFIMITLAFAQMIYHVIISQKLLGGEDGLTLAQRSQFDGLEINRPIVFYYFALAILLAALWATAIGVNTPFGTVVRGCKANERRMASLGYRTSAYRLGAYVISALVCVVAGALLVNLTRYVSPSFAQWTLSGELIVMVVLGGLGAVMGPLVGAFVLVSVEVVVPSLARLGLAGPLTYLSSHWLLLLGVIVLATALSLKRGIIGSLPNNSSVEASS